MKNKKIKLKQSVKSSILFSLSISLLSGAGAGAVIGTMLFPGIGSITGLIIGGVIGYDAGLIMQSYGKLICTPEQESKKINGFSGAFATIFTSSTIGGILGTFAFPGIGTIVGTLLGVAVGSGLCLTGIALTNFILPKIGNRFKKTADQPVVSPESGKTKNTEKSMELESTRFTLAKLGTYSGVGTLLGWTLGTFVFPGVGTAVGGIVGGFIGAAVGFSAESAKLVLDKGSIKQRLVGATGLSLTLLVPAAVGALVGTFILPGLGSAAGAGAGLALGASVAGIGAVSLLPRKIFSYAFQRVKKHFQNSDNNVGIEEKEEVTKNNSIIDILKSYSSVSTPPENILTKNPKKKFPKENNHQSNIKLSHSDFFKKPSNNQSDLHNNDAVYFSRSNEITVA